MIAVFGIFFTFIMVFGGYLLAGGKVEIILKSLPFEMMMIGGAAIGAFAISNSLGSIRSTLSDMRKVFGGALWRADDYLSIMLLLNDLLLLARGNPVELEAHVDAPKDSELFKKFPKVLDDDFAVSMICDTLRAGSMNYNDPHQIEELLDKIIEEKKHIQESSSHALQAVADGLPALGIVAAVLGVIKTMGSIDQPPEVLGKLIGGALVGTFLGVFLAYCLVAPFSAKVKSTADEDINFYKAIREILLSYFQGHSIKLSLEVARQTIPHHYRPRYEELSAVLRSGKLVD